MSIEGQIGATGRVIQGIGALLALMPALALLLGLVQIPPSLADLIKVLSFFITVCVVLAIILLRNAVRKLPAARMAILVMVAVLLGSVAATSYWIVAQRHLVAVKRGSLTEYFVVPLHPSARIREAVEPFQGDYAQAVYVSAQREQLRRWMEEESIGASVLLLVLLVVANVLLASAVVGGAWRLSGSLRKPAPAAGRQPA